MPTQPTVSQKARILQKLAEKAANRKADNAQDGSAEESEVHFLRNLTHVFPLESRKTLASNVIASSGSDAPELSDLSKLAEDCFRGFTFLSFFAARAVNMSTHAVTPPMELLHLVSERVVACTVYNINKLDRTQSRLKR